MFCRCRKGGQVGGNKSSSNPAIEEARCAGFDLDLLDSNLALATEERRRQHNLAL
jgi:hypothetical protein